MIHLSFHKKIPEKQGTSFAENPLADRFPWRSSGRTFSLTGSQAERTLFFGIPTNSRQLTYALTSCHTRQAPSGSPAQQSGQRLPAPDTIILSERSAFQHALRGPFFVSAYHPALTCPDSLWVPLTFYFRINGLFFIQFSILKRRINALSSTYYLFPDLFSYRFLSVTSWYT